MRAKLCNLVYCMDNNQKHENKKNRWTPRWNDICKSASKTRGSERQSSKITTFSREQRSAVKFHQQKMLKDHTEREKNLPLKLPYILHCMLACHYLSSPFTLPLRLSMSPCGWTNFFQHACVKVPMLHLVKIRGFGLFAVTQRDSIFCAVQRSAPRRFLPK